MPINACCCGSHGSPIPGCTDACGNQLYTTSTYTFPAASVPTVTLVDSTQTDWGTPLYSALATFSGTLTWEAIYYFESAGNFTWHSTPWASTNHPSTSFLWYRVTAVSVCGLSGVFFVLEGTTDPAGATGYGFLLFAEPLIMMMATTGNYAYWNPPTIHTDATNPTCDTLVGVQWYRDSSVPSQGWTIGTNSGTTETCNI